MIKKIPFLITVLSVITGLIIAIMFGVNEDLFKKHITEGLNQNTKIQSIEEVAAKEEKIKAETEKNWRYFQRFHFHATGISAMSFGLLLLLAFSKAPEILRLVASYGVAIGGFLYPFVWLFAGIFGPSMGRSEAKESFAIFGYMGGIYLLATIFTFVLLTIFPLKFNDRH